MDGIWHWIAERRQNKAEKQASFGETLSEVFVILSHGDPAVKEAITECLRDTEAYCRAHAEAFEARGLTYREDAVPWLQFIAAVNAMAEKGYVDELDAKDSSDAFRAAAQKVLTANHLTFSLERLVFDEAKAIPDWLAQGNEYAGQSGITWYVLDIDSDSYILGAAELADYACAAELAGRVGISVAAWLETATVASNSHSG